MSKVDDELTRRLQRAERPVDEDDLFEGLVRRRVHRERLHRVQASLVAFGVLVATAGGFAVLRDAFDADERDLGASPTPGVLPANGEIVFTRPLPDRSHHVFAVLPGVQGERLLTSGGIAVYQDPSVSPDGMTIAVTYSTQEAGQPVIATVPIDGGSPTLVTEPFARLSDPSWSPDGSQLAFAAATTAGHFSAIFVMDADGSELRSVVSVDGSNLSAPDWSPDGRTLVFVGLAVSTSEAERTTPDLYTVAPDGSGFTNLTASPDVGESSPSWSPEGRVIAYHRNAGGTNSVELIDSAGNPVGSVFEDDDAGEIGEIDWSPDGRLIAFTSALALVDSDIEGDLDIWTIESDGTRLTNLTTEGADGISWRPLSARSDPSSIPTPEPSDSPQPDPAGRDIGLGFNLCDVRTLGGIDFLGDGTGGRAWTGTKVLDDGSCPTAYDDRYGVAVDFTGDGLADSWSTETIKYCGSCEPFKGMDLNGDGREELIVILTYFSIMQYGVYTVIELDGEPEVVPFRTGEPGHPEHSLEAGRPFSFWVGGDAGLSDWFYCETLPTVWLTSTETPIEPGPGEVKTVHETQVSLGTDGIAQILYADTYTVPAEAQLDLPYTSPDFSDPDCGIGVRAG